MTNLCHNRSHNPNHKNHPRHTHNRADIHDGAIAMFRCFRKATETLKAPFGAIQDGAIAATIFAVTDSLPGKSVGEAVQTITDKEIKSEVEVRGKESRQGF